MAPNTPSKEDEIRITDIDPYVVRANIIPFLDRSTVVKILVGCEEISSHCRLDDFYCRDHGTLFSLKGDTMKNVLTKIKKDGKDPRVFEAKLALRTQVPCPYDWDSSERLEPLDDDEEYGEYLSMLKQCHKCEQASEARGWAEIGRMECSKCNEYTKWNHLTHCDGCGNAQGCYGCADFDLTCDYCHMNYCKSCGY
jgi:hypothetical protein